MHCIYLFFTIAPPTKATPHKARLTTLYVINLYLFRHITQKFLDIRQYACEISMQSDEKSNCVSAAQSLCGVALKLSLKFSLLIFCLSLSHSFSHRFIFLDYLLDFFVTGEIICHFQCNKGIRNIFFL